MFRWLRLGLPIDELRTLEVVLEERKADRRAVPPVAIAERITLVKEWKLMESRLDLRDNFKEQCPEKRVLIVAPSAQACSLEAPFLVQLRRRYE